MRTFITVKVPDDLLPQVTGELLQFTTNPDLVQVAFSETGRVIEADSDVVDAWMEWRAAREKAAQPPAPDPVPEPTPEPVPAPVQTAPEPTEPVVAPVPAPPKPVPAPKARTSSTATSASARSEE